MKESSSRKEMYNLLEQMLKLAEEGDKNKVYELSENFGRIAYRVYEDPMTELDFKYNNCESSIVSSFVYPEIKEDFLKDAKECFSKIPKPE